MGQDYSIQSKYKIQDLVIMKETLAHIQFSFSFPKVLIPFSFFFVQDQKQLPSFAGVALFILILLTFSLITESDSRKRSRKPCSKMRDVDLRIYCVMRPSKCGNLRPSERVSTSPRLERPLLDLTHPMYSTTFSQGLRRFSTNGMIPFVSFLFFFQNRI